MTADCKKIYFHSRHDSRQMFYALTLWQLLPLKCEANEMTHDSPTYVGNAFDKLMNNDML